METARASHAVSVIVQPRKWEVSLTILENSKTPSTPQLHKTLVLRSISQTPRKLKAEHHIQKQAEDLQCQTSNHDMHTCISSRIVTRRGSDASTNGLQDQRCEIAAYECDCVCARLEARVLGAVDDYEACEAEIERC